MAIKYKKTQNKMTGSKNYNKWYASAVHMGTVSTEDLCEEISHSTTVTEADVRAVFAELKGRLSAHLKNSQSVKVDGLGSFSVGLRSQLTDSAEKLTAANIKGYRIIFRPESQVVGRMTNTDGITKKVRGYKALQGITVEELNGGNVKSVKPADSGTGTGK
jgi:predicted histone-like DNA-binding protein